MAGPDDWRGWREDEQQENARCLEFEYTSAKQSLLNFSLNFNTLYVIFEPAVQMSFSRNGGS